jgi:hypothetical protein
MYLSNNGAEEGKTIKGYLDFKLVIHFRKLDLDVTSFCDWNKTS